MLILWRCRLCRTAEEIEYLKKLIKSKIEAGKTMLAQVIAKIERKEAIKNFDKILAATDAVMVARGDLGIEMPQADHPDSPKRNLRQMRPSRKAGDCGDPDA